MKPWFVMMLIGVVGSTSQAQDIGALLGSGRTDLVFKIGGKWKAVLFEKKNLSLSQLHNNGACDFDEKEDTLIFVGEAPWAKEMSNLDAGSLFAPQVPVRFDDHSAFIPGVFEHEDGALLRFQDGKIVLGGKAQPLARERYGLVEPQRFLGLVGTRVLYWNPGQPSMVYFFDLGSRSNVYQLNIPDQRSMFRTYHVSYIKAAYPGASPDEVWVNTLWQYKNYFPMSYRMNKLNLKDATLVETGTKTPSSASKEPVAQPRPSLKNLLQVSASIEPLAFISHQIQYGRAFPSD